ncbi:C-type lectin domain family 1 member A-like [Bombina bombina]|uniref:C-type lectin domain family 1 member A-like n=1 Tax=Bombina bombina TaxID=8345 RepID=UPI00235B0FBA|nr:C-type lectin domain family 1 member A-like [Bombina bombina]
MMDWTSCRDLCISEGGGLAVLNNPGSSKAAAEEKSKTGKDLWVALRNHNGNLQWNDGSPFTGEFAYRDETLGCYGLDNSGILSFHCDTKKLCLCEKKPEQL